MDKRQFLNLKHYFWPMQMLLSKYRGLILTTIVFATIYSLISIVNHYNFRTYALDLGAYTNALYDYAHFQWNDSTVFLAQPENLLADHFDLYLIAFSPFVWIFGTYTLLIVQIVALLFGGWGIYTFFNTREKTQHLALQATIFFYTFFGVFSALSFDYHSNVVAAMFVPWFMYYVRDKRLLPATIFLLIILVAKENMALWMAFVSLGLCIEYRSDRRLRKYLITCFIGCMLFFVLIIKVIMPAIGSGEAYVHFDYSHLGDGFKDAIIYLISHPIDAFQTLFINHNGSEFGDYVKTELHIILLISGLPILIWKPQFIIMLIPIYFQKLYHDNPSMWGIADQYSIEFAPIITIGVFSVIGSIKALKVKRILTYSVMTLALVGTIRIMDNPLTYLNKTRIRVYKQVHYGKHYDIDVVYKAFEQIPDDAIISVQSPFLAHLALRETLYQFPKIEDASYVLFSDQEETYPLSEDDFKQITERLIENGDWKILYDVDGVTLLQRIE